MGGRRRAVGVKVRRKKEELMCFADCYLQNGIDSPPVLFQMFSNDNLKTPQFFILHSSFFILHYLPRRWGYGFFDSAALRSE
jgi:hypothetical protein